MAADRCRSSTTWVMHPRFRPLGGRVPSACSISYIVIAFNSSAACQEEDGVVGTLLPRTLQIASSSSPAPVAASAVTSRSGRPPTEPSVALLAKTQTPNPEDRRHADRDGRGGPRRRWSGTSASCRRPRRRCRRERDRRRCRGSSAESTSWSTTRARWICGPHRRCRPGTSAGYSRSMSRARSRWCRPRCHHLRQSDNAHIVNVSPPLTMEPSWVGAHVGHTVGKYAESLLTLGWAAEFASIPIAVNSLWPATTVASTGMIVAMGEDAVRAQARDPRIMADAVHALVTRPPPTAAVTSSPMKTCSARRVCRTCRAIVWPPARKTLHRTSTCHRPRCPRCRSLIR